MEQIIYNLSNHQYHFGEEESQYISSTQLKWYEKSPKYYLHNKLYPKEDKNDNLRFGSCFHAYMEWLAKHPRIDKTGRFEDSDDIALFQPPINKNTCLPYGTATKAYKEAYAEFELANKDKIITTPMELLTISGMANSMTKECGEISKIITKLLQWGKPEVSYFYENEDGIKMKIRPDLITSNKVIDWKTTSLDDFSESSINRVISQYGYDISAAMYQWVLFQITHKYYTFYLVLVSKSEPFDCVIVDMSKWAYQYEEDDDILIPNIGAQKFMDLLKQHTYCVKHNIWKGAECKVSPNHQGLKIMRPTPPDYENWKRIDYFNED